MRRHLGKQFTKLTRNPGDNPEQLQMFMRPHEILSKLYGFADDTQNYDFGDDEDFGDPISPKDYPDSQLHHDKLQEAKDSGLHDSIETEGIRNHIVLQTSPHTTQFRMGNGHHRLSVALDLESKGRQVHIPVIHDADIMHDTYDEYKERYGRPNRPEWDWAE